MGYFCNRATNDYASICALVTTHTTTNYLEFSTNFTNGMTLATNTNAVLPLTPADPAHRISKIPGAEALYAIRRRFMAEYAIGWWPQGEPEGQEIGRYVRVVQDYGLRHTRIGYMRWKTGQMMAHVDRARGSATARHGPRTPFSRSTRCNGTEESLRTRGFRQGPTSAVPQVMQPQCGFSC